MDFDLEAVVNRIEDLNDKELEQYSQKCARQILSWGLSNPDILAKKRHTVEMCQKLTNKYGELLMGEFQKK